MLFTSAAFFTLLAVAFALYYLRPLSKFQVHILVLASLLFYSWHAPLLLCLLVASIALNAFTSSMTLTGPLARARLWLAAGVGINLLTLAFFKYAGLLLTTLRMNGSLASWVMTIPLPIGISFFTFEGISLCVDAFRARENEQVSRMLLTRRGSSYWLSTTLFVSFFPHLIAGPILKAHDFFPQIAPKKFSDIDWEAAFRALVVGYFLKMVVADNLQDQTFWIAAPHYQVQPAKTLLAMLFGFSMQIFADFAGYSLIAIGLAVLFGYRLPKNFNFPYIAESFSDFWRRWHISLSSWLREYLYVSLGGNRGGPLRTYVNLFAVMFLGGLWHGASWSFAVWGSAHGIALILERVLGRFITLGSSIPVRAIRMSTVFCVVTLAWLLFKLPDARDAWQYLSLIATKGRAEGLGPGSNLPALCIAIFSLPVIGYHLRYLVVGTSKAASSRWLDATCFGLMLLLIATNAGDSDAFIYFQF